MTVSRSICEEETPRLFIQFDAEARSPGGKLNSSLLGSYLKGCTLPYHMKIYLAGPMSGYPNFNFAAFDYAARKLRDLGFEVFSPAENDRKHHPGVEDNPTGNVALAEKVTGFTRRQALQDDTSWICREANAVALMPGWRDSTGARSEVALGVALGLTLIQLGTEFDLHAQPANT